MRLSYIRYRNFLKISLAFTGMFFLLCGFTGNQNVEVKRVYASPEIFWYGLDFQKVQLVTKSKTKTFGKKPIDTISNTYFPKWNRYVYDNKCKTTLK